MKKVSVIIPFYSHIDWLYEAVESVLAQTYPAYEIILVNDGSKEDMTGFLTKYGDRIKYVYQENAGPSTARNNGIRQASGDYIAFEDSDDVWLPTKLEKQVAFMEQIGARWCHAGFFYWWPETGRTKRVNVSRDYGDVFLQRHVSTQIATPNVMIDRTVFSEGDFYFPEGVRNGEDDQLYTKLAAAYPLALVEEPLLKVRMRGTNSQTHAIERFHLRATNYRRWMDEGQKLPFMVHLIYAFYRTYAALFRKKKAGRVKNFLAKCLWTIPYALERIYVRYLFRWQKKDERFLLRWDANAGAKSEH
jgi:glycosyltransferase involved in cell wall biosynthesis